MLIFNGKKPQSEFRLDFARMLCKLMNVGPNEILAEDDPILPQLPLPKKSAYK